MSQNTTDPSNPRISSSKHNNIHSALSDFCYFDPLHPQCQHPNPAKSPFSQLSNATHKHTYSLNPHYRPNPNKTLLFSLALLITALLFKLLFSKLSRKIAFQSYSYENLKTDIVSNAQKAEKSPSEDKNKAENLRKILKRAEKAGIAAAGLKMVALNDYLGSFSELDLFEGVSDPTLVSLNTMESIKLRLERSISAFECVVRKSNGVTHFFEPELDRAKIALKFSQIAFKLLVGLNPKNSGYLQEKVLKEGIEEFGLFSAKIAKMPKNAKTPKNAKMAKMAGNEGEIGGGAGFAKMKRLFEKAKEVDEAIGAFRENCRSGGCAAAVERAEPAARGAAGRNERSDGDGEGFREFEWLFGRKAEILRTQRGIQAVCGEISRFLAEITAPPTEAAAPHTEWQMHRNQIKNSVLTTALKLLEKRQIELAKLLQRQAAAREKTEAAERRHAAKMLRLAETHRAALRGAEFGRERALESGRLRREELAQLAQERARRLGDDEMAALRANLVAQGLLAWALRLRAAWRALAFGWCVGRRACLLFSSVCIDLTTLCQSNVWLCVAVAAAVVCKIGRFSTLLTLLFLGTFLMAGRPTMAAIAAAVAAEYFLFLGLRTFSFNKRIVFRYVLQSVLFMAVALFATVLVDF